VNSYGPFETEPDSGSVVGSADGTVREPDAKELARLALFICDMFDTNAGPVPIGDRRGAGVEAARSALASIPLRILKHWGG
jgi:hypothetical protein